MSKIDKAIKEIEKTVKSELDWATKRNKKHVITLFSIEEAELILEIIKNIQKGEQEVRDHDMTEYAFRNGYDKALEDFLEGTIELRKKYIPTSSNDFLFGTRNGITECRQIALQLKAKNNGEEYTEDTDDLQIDLPTDKA